MTRIPHPWAERGGCPTLAAPGFPAGRSSGIGAGATANGDAGDGALPSSAADAGRALIARLPAVRGRLRPGVALAPLTWFGVGGPADVVFEPADAADLAAFLATRPRDVPVFVLGAGSNLLVRDAGIPGVVVRLGPAFATLAVEGADLVCGAGALDGSIARAAQTAGLAGFEFLVTIPGTLGGALRMNAGAHGADVRDRLVSVDVLDGRGDVRTLAPEALKLSYRACGLPADRIFVGARLRGTPDSPAAIAERMAALRALRAQSQPRGVRTGGSTFANPDPALSGGRRAWELIDAAGCRGLTLGRAQVSPQHCNFLINTGGATAAEIEALGEQVRARVLDHCGVALRWEIRRVGLADPTLDPIAPIQPEEDPRS